MECSMGTYKNHINPRVSRKFVDVSPHPAIPFPSACITSWRTSGAFDYFYFFSFPKRWSLWVSGQWLEHKAYVIFQTPVGNFCEYILTIMTLRSEHPLTKSWSGSGPYLQGIQKEEAREEKKQPYSQQATLHFFPRIYMNYYFLASDPVEDVGFGLKSFSSASMIGSTAASILSLMSSICNRRGLTFP